jgi:hypothetical protein
MTRVDKQLEIAVLIWMIRYAAMAIEAECCSLTMKMIAPVRATMRSYDKRASIYTISLGSINSNILLPLHSHISTSLYPPNMSPISSPSSFTPFPPKSLPAQKRWFAQHSHFSLSQLHPTSKTPFLSDLRATIASITNLDEATLDQFWRDALETQVLFSLGPRDAEMTAVKVQMKILKKLEYRRGDVYRSKEFRGWILEACRVLYRDYAGRMGICEQIPELFSLDEQDGNRTACPPTEDFYLTSSSATTPPLTIIPPPPTPELNNPGLPDNFDTILSELFIPINHLWSSNPTFSPQHASPERIGRKEISIPDSPTYPVFGLLSSSPSFEPQRLGKEIPIPDSPVFGLLSEEEEEKVLYEHVGFECEDGEGRVWKEPRWWFEFGFC